MYCCSRNCGASPKRAETNSEEADTDDSETAEATQYKDTGGMVAYEFKVYFMSPESNAGFPGYNNSQKMHIKYRNTIYMLIKQCL